MNAWVTSLRGPLASARDRRATVAWAAAIERCAPSSWSGVSPRCEKAARTWGPKIDEKTEPMMATPNVPPSSRVVSLLAAPAPTCSGFKVPMMVVVAGALMSENPSAITIIEPMIGPKNAADALMVAAHARAKAMTASPALTT